MDQTQLNTMFKRFAANRSADFLSGYTLVSNDTTLLFYKRLFKVPLFNQEVAHSLKHGESVSEKPFFYILNFKTNFSVPLQSKGLKSKNCVALQIQVNIYLKML